MTASAFSLAIAVPAEAFAVTEGEPELGGLHGAQRHHFCGWCKSWLFTRIDEYDWFVNLRATALDDPAWFAPFVETCTAEKLAWAATPAVHSYPGLPEEADWPRLVDGVPGARGRYDVSRARLATAAPAAQDGGDLKRRRLRAISHPEGAPRPPSDRDRALCQIRTNP